MLPYFHNLKHLKNTFTKKKAIEKWAEELNIHFSKDKMHIKKKKTRYQACKKMFNITNHEGNANQNQSEKSAHTNQNDRHQREHK